MNNRPMLTAYTDGASRGNPGPAGAGYVIKKDDVVLEEFSRYIRRNN